MIDIEALRKLEQAATPGPWFPEVGRNCIVLGLQNNEAFIAAARNAMPALLDEIEHLRNTENLIHWSNEAAELQIEIGEIYRDCDKVLTEIIESPDRAIEIASRRLDDLLKHEMGWRTDSSLRAKDRQGEHVKALSKDLQDARSRIDALEAAHREIVELAKSDLFRHTYDAAFEDGIMSGRKGCAEISRRALGEGG